MISMIHNDYLSFELKKNGMREKKSYVIFSVTIIIFYDKYIFKINGKKIEYPPHLSR